MAIYLIVAGGTFAGSGLVETGSGLGVDFNVVGRQGFVTTIGNGSATSIVVTHNLGTQDVAVDVYRVASPFDTVYMDVERTTTNTATLKFASAPATNEYRVVVQPRKV